MSVDIGVGVHNKVLRHRQRPADDLGRKARNLAGVEASSDPINGYVVPDDHNRLDQTKQRVITDTTSAL
ncbi:hypothetical protein [Nisaea sp.]|uniref:hypothetical protein n=1 Tax=Nisaea sp. TaxID=2024842 RepID=UPI003266DDE3